MAVPKFEIICCSERAHLLLDEESLKKDYCEYEDRCPVGKWKMRVRVAKGVLARAICECGGKNIGLVRYEEAKS